MSQTLYDPERWLETTVRAIKDYTTSKVNTTIYDVVMEFPGSIIDAMDVPLTKTIIHFELDDINSKPVGFGDGMFADNYDSVNQEITPQYGSVHLLTFDVGVWASDRSGGVTQRMRAKQLLQFLFDVNGGGAQEFQNLTDNGDGLVEVLKFSGGRFVLDKSANDQRLYRMVDCQLEVRVFSRTSITGVTPIPTVEEILQDNSGITIIG